MFWWALCEVKISLCAGKGMWRKWCYLNTKVWMCVCVCVCVCVWSRSCLHCKGSQNCLHNESKESWNCLHNEIIWAKVISYYDDNMGRSCSLLWWHAWHEFWWCVNEVFHHRCINMPISLNGKEHMYIYIQLDCIWFEWCLVWICQYIYILRSFGIFLCLYDQVMMSMIFIFDWCYVLYSLKL